MVLCLFPKINFTAQMAAEISKDGTDFLSLSVNVFSIFDLSRTFWRMRASTWTGCSATRWSMTLWRYVLVRLHCKQNPWVKDRTETSIYLLVLYKCWGKGYFPMLNELLCVLQRHTHTQKNVCVAMVSHRQGKCKQGLQTYFWHSMQSIKLL